MDFSLKAITFIDIMLNNISFIILIENQCFAIILLSYLIKFLVIFHCYIKINSQNIDDLKTHDFLPHI